MHACLQCLSSRMLLLDPWVSCLWASVANAESLQLLQLDKKHSFVQDLWILELAMAARASLVESLPCDVVDKAADRA